MDTKRGATQDLPILLFTHQNDWATWLSKNHARSPGVWLRIGKKGSGLESVSYNEALLNALCYGWIDGQKRSYDELSWLQKFTRRGAKSVWSKINRKKAEELIERGKMKAAGLEAVANAKKDGRWDAAYDSQRSASVPPDFQAALDDNPKARVFFSTLDGINRYAILYRLQTAKQAETRARRIAKFIQMLEKKEKIYP